MDFNRFQQRSSYTREEYIQKIEHSLTKLSDSELEALYYDMLTKDYIRNY